MEFDAVLLAPRRAPMIERKLWHDRTINDYLNECLARCPDKPALAAFRADGNEPRRFTYREMATMADRIA
ncbi:MAG TPA: cyclohexanecarboxylate-CoA ligase, partial [Burkholderiaceae bacterium]|nr:cyclohexanecarboxylate-CoA ligase [Burkholderiaceae bacterium]